MPIKRLTPQSEADRYLEEAIDRRVKAIVNIFCYVGEQVVNIARKTELKGNDFTDRTGNLRSSTGYIVAVDGKVAQMSSFESIRVGRARGSDGASKGKAFAKELIREFPTGIVLIVVAGMEYAAYVSDRGYDVLTSAELQAEHLVPQMLEKLGIKR